MNTGMLWVNESGNADFSSLIAQAIYHYQKKFGYKPNLCYVHPSIMLAEGPNTHPEIIIRVNTQLEPIHIWVGRQETIGDSNVTDI